MKAELVQRKSDMRKKESTAGFEFMLCHDFGTNITSAFCKGTPSSVVVESIALLKRCGQDAQHPLLFPMIILSNDGSSKTDVKQRDARNWVRRFEHAIAMRFDNEEKEAYVKDGLVDLDAVNRDMVECHAQGLTKRPIAFLRLIDTFTETLDLISDHLCLQRNTPDMQRIQDDMRSRLDFYKKKWQGTDTYSSKTLERIEIQKSSVSDHSHRSHCEYSKTDHHLQLYNIIAQKESKLNFQMAIEQRKLAQLSKRDSSTMKTISLLGSVFLPGQYLAVMIPS